MCQRPIIFLYFEATLSFGASIIPISIMPLIVLENYTIFFSMVCFFFFLAQSVLVIQEKGEAIFTPIILGEDAD